MAGYCGYCGTPLDKNGLCPNCGNEDEATGLLTPGDMPAFYTEGQGALFGGGPAADAEPEQTPYSYPVVDPRPTLDGPPVYPGSGYGAQQGYARQDPAPGPDRVAYAAPQPEKQPKRATPKKPSKGGRGKKLALIAGSCVLGVALIVGLLFAFGVIRLKSDPLVGEVYFLVTPAEHIQTDADTGLRYADNELLVVARTGVKKRDMETVAKKYHAAVVGFIEVTGDYQLQLEEPLSKDDLEQLSVTIASEPEVASAEPNRVVTLRRTAAAPANEKNETPAATPETYWNLRQIRAYEAWTTVNAHENEIKPVAIGMISDGAPTGHKDIPLKESFFESNGDVGHALAVAGIMAADGTNADGFSGVYPYASGRLYAASTEGMTDSGVSVMWEKAAIAKLLVSGVKVLNCGYGTEMTDFLDLTAAADTLGDYLNRSLNAGYDFLLVAPAPDATGESTLSAIDGAKYPNVRAHILTTGGSDEDGQPLASGSHDLIAPQGKETAIYSAVPGGYGFVGNDASLAAPHVSGAAALVWSVDERLTGDAVRRILISTAQANRLLDVNAAVAFALENKGKDAPTVAEQDSESESSSEPMEPEQSAPPILPEEAVEIYYSARSLWLPEDFQEFSAPYYHRPETCFFLDLDLDGVPELIRSSMQGSGLYTYSDFYRIDPTTRTVYQLDLYGYEGRFSEYDGPYQLFCNRETGEMVYYAEDIERDGMPNVRVICGIFRMENDIPWNRYLYGEQQEDEYNGESFVHKEWKLVADEKGMLVQADDQTYEAAVKEFNENYINLNMAYREMETSDVLALDDAALRDVLMELYLSFSYDGFDLTRWVSFESEPPQPSAETEPETTQPQPSAGNLEATEVDFAALGQRFDDNKSVLNALCFTIYDVFDTFGTPHFTISFDAEKRHNGNAAPDLFFLTLCPLYNIYFTTPKYSPYSEEEHLFPEGNNAYEYVSFPLDSLNWLAKNVLNYDGFTAEDYMSLNENTRNHSAEIDGNLCILVYGTDYLETVSARMDTAERQPDGTYRFTVLFQYEDPDGTKDGKSVGTLIAAVREDGGRRYWSILKFDADVTF